MRSILGHLAVAIAGVVSFSLTVAAIVMVQHYMGFNFFTLSFWLIFPVGAMLSGAAAASGYYFASLALHTRPNWFMLVQVLVVAAAAMVTIYYLEYATMSLDGVRVSNLVSFVDYVQIYLTTQEITVGRSQTGTGEVGDFGYALAGIQFLGFIAGGLFVWLMLRAQPVCSDCGKYVRTLVKRTQQFSTQDEFTAAYDTLFKHPVASPGFNQALRWSPRPAGQAATAGVIQTTSTLKGCPHCGRQQIHQAVTVMSGKGEWKDVAAFNRAVTIPLGTDLRPSFQ